MTSPAYSFPFHIWKFERNCTKIYSLDYFSCLDLSSERRGGGRELIPFAIGVGIIVSPRANFWVHSVFCLFSGVLFWIIIGQSLARASTARRYRTGWSVVLLLLPSRFVQGRFDRPLDGVGSRSRIFLTPAAVDNKIQKLVSVARLFFYSIQMRKQATAIGLFEYLLFNLIWMSVSIRLFAKKKNATFFRGNCEQDLIFTLTLPRKLYIVYTGTWVANFVLCVSSLPEHRD
jgi:hypothetical protein